MPDIQSTPFPEANETPATEAIPTLFPEMDCPESVECPECGASTTAENIVEAYPDNGTNILRYRISHRVCRECTFTCNDCNVVFRGSPNHVNASDDSICERCADNYVTCYGCDAVVYMDDSYSDNNNETYCRSCYDNIERDEEEPAEDDIIIHSYSYKPAAIFFRADKQCPKPGLMYCGLEIEFQGDTSVYAAVKEAGIPDSSLWYAKKDGSVDVEIVSHPATWEFWKTASFRWADSLVASGLRSYDAENCGMHVHVSRSALSALDILKLLQFFRKNERYIHRLSRRRRGKMNEYARIDTASSVNTICYKAKRPDTAYNRYEAINLCNEKTVEFRIFRGTASRKGILRNLSFVVAICAFVKDTGLTALGVRDFHKWLKHKGHVVLGKEEAKALRQWAISRNSLIENEQ